MTPAKTVHVAELAARRALLALFLRRAGACLSWGGGLALGVAAGMKAAGWPGELIAVAGVLGAAVVCAAAWALAGRWSVARAARELDARLGLHDRLSSGLALASEAGSDAFAAIAVSDAERAAVSVAFERAIPLRAGRTWRVWPVLMMAAVGVAVFAPRAERGSRAAGGDPGASVGASEAALAIEGAAEELRRAAVSEPAPVRSVHDAAVADLERELKSVRERPGESLARAASAVGEAADAMESLALSERSRWDRTRDALSRAAPNERGREVSDVMKRLAQGDMDGAAGAARDLGEHADSLPPEERERIARELEEAARRIDEAARQESHEAGEEDERAAGGPAEPSEQRQSPAADPSGVAPGAPPANGESARPRAGDKQPADPAERDADASRDAEGRLAEAMRDAARELRERPSPERREGTRGENPQGEVRRPGADGSSPGQRGTGSRDAEQPRESRPPANPPAGQPERPGDQEGAESQPRPGESNPGDARSPRPSPDKPGEGGASRQEPGAPPTPGEHPSSDRGPGPERGDPAGTPGKPPERASRPKDLGGGGARPDAPPRPQAGTEQGRPEGGAQGEGSGLERLERELERMAREGRGIDRRLTESKRLREQAESLLARASPEQRRRLEELASRLAGSREAGDGPRGPVTPPAPVAPIDGVPTTPVDARAPGGEGGLTIADWLGEGGQGPAAPRIAEGLRQAAEGAERAIEQQAVPARHSDLVRRVFERYARRASGGAGQGPVQDAPDAPKRRD